MRVLAFIGSLALAHPGACAAEISRCVGSDGRVTYQQVPCRAGTLDTSFAATTEQAPAATVSDVQSAARQFNSILAQLRAAGELCFKWHPRTTFDIAGARADWERRHIGLMARVNEVLPRSAETRKEFDAQIAAEIARLEKQMGKEDQTVKTRWCEAYRSRALSDEMNPRRASPEVVRLLERGTAMEIPVQNDTASIPPAAITRSAALGTLATARKGFRTRMSFTLSGPVAEPVPPANLFTAVRYPSPAGDLLAFLTPDPGDGKKRPAIIWLTGGDTNALGDFWTEGPTANDQSASAYRKAGVLMLFPTLRGGNRNPGVREAFFGEVDDVLAASRFLAAQPYVDPRRIYLGGHGAGGTLALLVAEMGAQFRAVFALGPVSRIGSYFKPHGKVFPIDSRAYDPLEMHLRDPYYWLQGVRSRIFVIEGTREPANIIDLDHLEANSRAQPLIQIIRIAGVDHFGLLGPANKVIAERIMADNGAGTFEVRWEDLQAAVRTSSPESGASP